MNKQPEELIYQISEFLGPTDKESLFNADKGNRQIGDDTKKGLELKRSVEKANLMKYLERYIKSIIDSGECVGEPVIKYSEIDSYIDKVKLYDDSNEPTVTTNQTEYVDSLLEATIAISGLEYIDRLIKIFTSDDISKEYLYEKVKKEIAVELTKRKLKERVKIEDNLKAMVKHWLEHGGVLDTVFDYSKMRSYMDQFKMMDVSVVDGVCFNKNAYTLDLRGPAASRLGLNNLIEIIIDFCEPGKRHTLIDGFKKHFQPLIKYEESDSESIIMLLGNWKIIINEGDQSWLNHETQHRVLIFGESKRTKLSGYYGHCGLRHLEITGNVESIPDSMFGCNAKLISVHLSGGSLKTIGTNAFMNCPSLKYFYMYDSTPSFEFAVLGMCYKLETCVLPKSLTSIGELLFSGCESLCDFIIPESVTHIKKAAFGECFSLSSVIIPNSVTRIDERTFEYCKTLKSCILSTNITTIPENMFEGCGELVEIVVPKSVTKIGKEAFNKCTSLVKVILENPDTVIASDAFKLCGDVEIVRG
jgi:hypothetical protein